MPNEKTMKIFYIMLNTAADGGECVVFAAAECNLTPATEWLRY
jgi:hypothetical protein